MKNKIEIELEQPSAEMTWDSVLGRWDIILKDRNQSLIIHLGPVRNIDEDHWNHEDAEMVMGTLNHRFEKGKKEHGLLDN